MALFCSKCGTQLEEGSRFCSKCGAVTVPGEEQGATSNPNVGSLADSLKDMTLMRASFLPISSTGSIQKWKNSVLR